MPTAPQSYHVVLVSFDPFQGAETRLMQTLGMNRTDARQTVQSMMIPFFFNDAGLEFLGEAYDSAPEVITQEIQEQENKELLFLLLGTILAPITYLLMGNTVVAVTKEPLDLLNPFKIIKTIILCIFPFTVAWVLVLLMLTGTLLLLFNFGSLDTEPNLALICTILSVAPAYIAGVAGSLMGKLARGYRDRFPKALHEFHNTKPL